MAFTRPRPPFTAPGAAGTTTNVGGQRPLARPPVRPTVGAAGTTGVIRPPGKPGAGMVGGNFNVRPVQPPPGPGGPPGLDPPPGYQPGGPPGPVPRGAPGATGGPLGPMPQPTFGRPDVPGAGGAGGNMNVPQPNPQPPPFSFADKVAGRQLFIDRHRGSTDPRIMGLLQKKRDWMQSRGQQVGGDPGPNPKRTMEERIQKKTANYFRLSGIENPNEKQQAKLAGLTKWLNKYGGGVPTPPQEPGPTDQETVPPGDGTVPPGDGGDPTQPQPNPQPQPQPNPQPEAPTGNTMGQGWQEIPGESPSARIIRLNQWIANSGAPTAPYQSQTPPQPPPTPGGENPQPPPGNLENETGNPVDQLPPKPGTDIAAMLGSDPAANGGTGANFEYLMRGTDPGWEDPMKAYQTLRDYGYTQEQIDEVFRFLNTPGNKPTGPGWATFGST